jgi:hypothetical protein
VRRYRHAAQCQACARVRVSARRSIGHLRDFGVTIRISGGVADRRGNTLAAGRGPRKGLRTEEGRWRREDGGLKMEEGRRRNLGRGRKAEDGGVRTEEEEERPRSEDGGFTSGPEDGEQRVGRASQSAKCKYQNAKCPEAESATKTGARKKPSSRKRGCCDLVVQRRNGVVGFGRIWPCIVQVC